MAPTAQTFMVFTSAVDEVVSRYPAEDSQAMRELHAEDQYRHRSSWQNPIGDTHTLGAMTLRAVIDYVRTFAKAFSVGAPPVYGHLVVTRSALESSVVTAWLNEPGIAYDERVKRGMCELLYSANEVRKLKLPATARGAAEIKADVTKFGWEIAYDHDRPVVDGTKRLPVGDGITKLLSHRSEARLGRLLWNRLSAVTHVTWVGLNWAVDPPDAKPDSGFAKVSVGSESTQVALQAFCILKALRVAATRRVVLMGWNDAQWQAACQQAEEREHFLLAHYLASFPADQ
jgi:hypothetical protein